MKTYIIIILLSVLSLSIEAQYRLKNSVVMHELEIESEQLQNQLDSILFVKYPCNMTSRSKREGYVFFTQIREKNHGDYIISIACAKPSGVENDINTGLYRSIDKHVFIIREKSKTPLFKVTGKKEHFLFNKNLMRKSKESNELEEIIFPEEVCTWVLSYTDGQLKMLSLNEDYQDNAL